MIRFFDLFGGIGGFRLGLEKANCGLAGNRQTSVRVSRGREAKHGAGNDYSQDERPSECVGVGAQAFDCVGYCDFDKYAVQCYNANYHETNAPSDARKLDDSNLPEFDLLCAGFPCQPFSLAGKRRAFADEERGTLFHEIARILEVRKPDFVLLENVKGLLSAQQGYCFAFILEWLGELGYDCEWEVLNSKNFGVPQNRERVFIFGSRKRSGCQIFPLGQSNSVLEEKNGRTQSGGQGVCSTIHGGYANLQEQGETYLIEDRRQSGEVRVKTEVNVNAHYGTGGGNVPMILQKHFFERTQEWGDGIYEDFVPTMDSGSGRDLVVAPCLTEAQGRQGSSQEFLSACEKINLSSGSLRRLTPVECERLQGFPDGWTSMLSDSRRYKCLGNAVTVNVVRAVGEKIASVLEEGLK